MDSLSFMHIRFQKKIGDPCVLTCRSVFFNHGWWNLFSWLLLALKKGRKGGKGRKKKSNKIESMSYVVRVDIVL